MTEVTEVKTFKIEQKFSFKVFATPIRNLLSEKPNFNLLG